MASVDVRPDGGHELQEWLRAEPHLQLMRDNAQSEELIGLGFGPYTLIHAVAVPEDALVPLDQSDLLGWSGNAFSVRSGYVLSGDDVQLDERGDGWGTRTLREARQLVFERIADRFGPGSGTSVDILQEYLHASDIHWLSERSAHCRIDDQGDIEQTVSITTGDVTLASFRREPLERYLVASGSVLVRMFEFSLIDPKGFAEWGDDGEEVVVEEEDSLFYKRRIGLESAFARGVQILRPSLTKADVAANFRGTRRNDPPVEFVALDWRHERVARVSTHPSATTNYFVAEHNDLPYGTSPAFFRPDVLAKYKSDHEKYQIESRMISCRGLWSLPYDVNDADQVHVYICDLQHLPYSEQLHWASHNETSKVGISQRALEIDFEGKWSSLSTPLEDVLTILRRWSEDGVPWWTLRRESLLQRVNVPLTDSSDEWTRAFLDFAKLVIEGFELSWLREQLTEHHTSYGKDERSLKLLESLLQARGTSAKGVKLHGLRAVQQIRSKGEAHVPGTEAGDLASHALAEHGTYATHFRTVCRDVAGELRLLEEALS